MIIFFQILTFTEAYWHTNLSLPSSDSIQLFVSGVHKLGRPSGPKIRTFFQAFIVLFQHFLSKIDIEALQIRQMGF